MQYSYTYCPQQYSSSTALRAVLSMAVQYQYAGMWQQYRCILSKKYKLVGGPGGKNGENLKKHIFFTFWCFSGLTTVLKLQLTKLCDQ